MILGIGVLWFKFIAQQLSLDKYVKEAEREGTAGFQDEDGEDGEDGED